MARIDSVLAKNEIVLAVKNSNNSRGNWKRRTLESVAAQSRESGDQSATHLHYFLPFFCVLGAPLDPTKTIHQHRKPPT